MAYFKDASVLEKNHHDAFDALHAPGTQVEYSGIYRCAGCGNEVASNATPGDRFPPENHHKHKPEQGKIRWQLIVATQA